MRSSWQLLLLGLVVVVMGVALVFQRRINWELQGTVELLREQSREVDRLRTEGTRLRAKEISTAELERLRADHAAVARLRDEIEAARARIAELERAESASPPAN